MDKATLEDLLATARKAALSAGDYIAGRLGRLSASGVAMKQAFDFVTEVDTGSEELIIRDIRADFPGHAVLSEESLKEAAAGGYRWIIDPLDGTTNFIHQYPVFAVSIAVEFAGEAVAGVVYDPTRKELFHATRGGGAFLNGSPIRVSSVDRPENALITTGFPFRAKETLDRYLMAFGGIFQRVSDLRRSGSAALDLAYVASGRCEGFFELGLKPWDMAAGALMISEAGGVVTDFSGGGEYLGTGNIVASVPALHGVLLGEIRAVFSGIIDK
jgi:myo-inositol-1(or 4)-monophosphatase